MEEEEVEVEVVTPPVPQCRPCPPPPVRAQWTHVGRPASLTEIVPTSASAASMVAPTPVLKVRHEDSSINILSSDC